MSVMEVLSSVDWGKILEPILGTLVTLILGYLATKLPQATKAGMEQLKAQADKLKNEYAAGVLKRLIDAVGAKVLEYENTAIEQLKEDARLGKLSWSELPERLRALKEKLIAEVKEDASLQGLWKSALEVFGGDENALTKWLSGIVETHVSTLPPSGLQTVNGSLTAPAMSVVPQLPPAAATTNE